MEVEELQRQRRFRGSRSLAKPGSRRRPLAVEGARNLHKPAPFALISAALLEETLAVDMAPPSEESSSVPASGRTAVQAALLGLGDQYSFQNTQSQDQPLARESSLSEAE